MPVNTIPQRCLGAACPECTSSAGAGFHKCAGSTTEPCCTCFASTLTIDHVALPATSLPPDIDRWNISVSWNAATGRWDGTAFNSTTSGDVEIYIERVDGDCYLKIVSDVLDLDEEWVLDGLAETCRTLHFTTTLSDGSTIVINGNTTHEVGCPSDDPPPCCTTLCCEPGACFELLVSGTLIATNPDTSTDSETFEVTLAFDEATSFGDALGRCASSAINSSAEFELTGQTWHVDVIASFVGRTLVVLSQAYIGTIFHAAATQLYSVDLHEPGTECSTLGLTEEDTSGYGYPVSEPPFATMSLAMDAATEIVPDTDCVPTPSPCAIYPRCLTFRMSEATNDDCTECDDFNLPVNTLIRAIGTCTWFGQSYASGHCIADAGGFSGRWVLGYDDDSETWTLSFIIYDAVAVAIGALVVYELVGDATTAFPKQLTFLSGSGDCNWPSTIFLNACSSGNFLYGACCEDGDSTGIVICSEMLASDCTSVGGTFLGVGTRCFLEGCSACSDECNTFCDTYTLTFEIAAPIGCGVFPNTLCSSTLTRDPGCTWLNASDCYPDDYPVDSWAFSLTIDTATSPPTRTLTATWTDGTDSISFTAVSAVGYCEAPTVNFEITSWASTFCGGDDPLSYTIRKTQLAGCPEFLP